MAAILKGQPTTRIEERIATLQAAGKEAEAAREADPDPEAPAYFRKQADDKRIELERRIEEDKRREAAIASPFTAVAPLTAQHTFIGTPTPSPEPGPFHRHPVAMPLTLPPAPDPDNGAVMAFLMPLPSDIMGTLLDLATMAHGEGLTASTQGDWFVISRTA